MAERSPEDFLHLLDEPEYDVIDNGPSLAWLFVPFILTMVILTLWIVFK